MDVSIIVPLTGDPERALLMMQALARLPERPAHEVILVDAGSSDLGPVLARVGGEDVAVVRLEESAGAAAAVRAGLPRARGAVVLVLAEGALLHPDAPAALAAALRDERLAAVTSAARHPAAAHAIAWRRGGGHASVAVPDTDDVTLVAALACTLAATGRVVAAPAAIVAPPAGEDTVARARSVPGALVELSVVVPTLDAAGTRARACVRALQRHTEVPYELIVVDNGAPPQGFTAPVNAGLRAARGAHLVVCNDDVLVEPGWWPPLYAALTADRDPAAVAFPRTVGGAMREDFAAWCFALSRATLEEFAVAPGEFLDPELKVWFQDTDLLHRLRAAGRAPRLVNASTIRHGLSETVASPDPRLRAWIDEQIASDQAHFTVRHGVAVPGAAR